MLLSVLVLNVSCRCILAEVEMYLEDVPLLCVVSKYFDTHIFTNWKNCDSIDLHERSEER